MYFKILFWKRSFSLSLEILIINSPNLRPVTIFQFWYFPIFLSDQQPFHFVVVFTKHCMAWGIFIVGIWSSGERESYMQQKTFSHECNTPRYRLFLTKRYIVSILCKCIDLNFVGESTYHIALEPTLMLIAKAIHDDHLAKEAHGRMLLMKNCSTH